MKKSSNRVFNTKKNIIYSFIFQFSKIMLVFINRMIFVKVIGATYLGINGLFSNLLEILSLADLGMNTVMMYCLYEPIANQNHEKINCYLTFFKKIYNLIALVVFASGLLLLPFLKYLINLPESVPHIYIYYLLQLVNTVMTYLFVYQTSVTVADQKQYLLNKVDISFQYILFILQLILLITTQSYMLYLISSIACTLVCNIFKVRVTRKHYPYLNSNSDVKLSNIEKKNLFSNMSSLFLYKIGSVIQGNTDNILISIYVGTITVGYYSNYNTIIISITTFITMIFSSLKASLGNFIVEKSKTEQLNIFDLLENINFCLICFCSVCFITLIPDFVEICFGKQYVLSFSLLIFAVINFYTSNIRQTIWALRETTGIFKKTKYITLVTSTLNLGLSIIFGKYFGLVGIIGATTLARMLYAWWKEPVVIFRDYFNISAKKYFLNYVSRFFTTVIICIITLIISNLLKINNIYLMFIYKMFISIVVPTLLLLIIYKDSYMLKYLQERIIKK